MLAGAASAAPAAAQTRTLAGRVFEARTGRPVSGGEVVARGFEARDRIRPDGVFVLRLPNSPVVLDIRSPGYLGRALNVGSRRPLYVVEGVVVSDAQIASGIDAVTGGQSPVPGRIGDLNPGDVRRVQVLRGAAATAVFGSRGQRGDPHQHAPALAVIRDDR